MVIDLRKILLLNNDKLIVLSLFMAFIAAAPVVAFLPVLRHAFYCLFFIAITFFLVNNNDFYKKNKHVIAVWFSIIVLLSILNSYYDLSIAGLEFYFYFSIALGFFVAREMDSFLTLIKIWVVLNFFALIYEAATGKYLVNINTAYEDYYYYYLRGLFSDPKGGAFFILMAGVIVRGKSKLIFIIALLSSFMSGSRTAMLGLSVIFLVDLVYNTFLFNKSLLTFVKKFLGLIILLGIVFVAIYAYLLEHIILLDKLLVSFDMQSSSHSVRSYMWLTHFKLYLFDFTLWQMVFGYSGYTRELIGNGAESSWVMLLTEGGIIAFMIYFIPMCILISRAFKNFYLYYPFVVIMALMMVGRVCVGFADGTILWGLIFSMIKVKNF